MARQNAFSICKALLQSRVNDAGKLTRVSLTNITVADSDKVKLKVSNPLSTKAALMGQYTPETDVEPIPTKEDGIFEITLKNLKPWSVSTVFFE